MATTTTTTITTPFLKSYLLHRLIIAPRTPSSPFLPFFSFSFHPSAPPFLGQGCATGPTETRLSCHRKQSGTWNAASSKRRRGRVASRAFRPPKWRKVIPLREGFPPSFPSHNGIPRDSSREPVQGEVGVDLFNSWEWHRKNGSRGRLGGGNEGEFVVRTLLWESEDDARSLSEVSSFFFSLSWFLIIRCKVVV